MDVSGVTELTILVQLVGRFLKKRERLKKQVKKRIKALNQAGSLKEANVIINYHLNCDGQCDHFDIKVKVNEDVIITIL